MLNLKAYSGRDIQNTKSLLTQILKTGKNITVRDIIALLDSEVNKLKREIEEPLKHGSKKCPSCRKGYLLHTPNYEGLNIVSCKKCRYSTILEEEIENG